MSSILDALRSKSAGGIAGGASAGDARSDAVLATLGYPRAPGRPRLRLRTMALYGALALVAGFAVVSALILTLAPSDSEHASRGVRPTAAAETRPSVSNARPHLDARVAMPQIASASAAAPAETAASAVQVDQQPLAPRLNGPLAYRSDAVLVAPRLPAAQPPSLSASTPSATPRISTTANAPPTPSTATAAPLTTTATVRPTSATVAAPKVAARNVAPSGAPPRAVGLSVAKASAAIDARPDNARHSAALVTSETSAPDHFALALYYQRIADFDSALTHYRALLERSDASAEVHNNLGLLYQDHAQPDDAMRQFQRAIAINPKYAKAHNNLGVALMRVNQLDEAEQELRVALVAEPRNVESLVNLALVERAAGRIVDARALLRRALTIDPRSAGSHYNLAVVADENGDAATAIEHYRAFLRLGAVANGGLAGQVRARLTALGG